MFDFGQRTWGAASGEVKSEEDDAADCGLSARRSGSGDPDGRLNLAGGRGATERFRGETIHGRTGAEENAPADIALDIVCTVSTLGGHD